MRRLLASIVLLGIITLGAQADPNDLSGGVFIAHYVAELGYSSDAPVLGWCGQYVADYAISEFEDQVNRIDTATYLPSSWFVIAAWWDDKIWCGTEFGFAEYDPQVFGILEWSACYPPDGGLEIPTAGWPGPGEGIAFVVTGTPWEGNFVPVMWFGGYAYGYFGADIIALDVDPPTAFAGFSNCAAPPIPYEAMELGGMGINMDGIFAGWPIPDPGACCVDTTCHYVIWWECDNLGGEFLGALIPCEPNPCAVLPGACCLPPPGDCEVLTQEECLALQGEWLGPNTECEPNPCPGVCCLGWDHVHVLQAECALIGGLWLGNIPCDPNPCPGACCVDLDCYFIPYAECDSLGGVAQDPWTTCDPNPCEPTPTQGTTWGRIKGMYR